MSVINCPDCLRHVDLCCVETGRCGQCCSAYRQRTREREQELTALSDMHRAVDRALARANAFEGTLRLVLAWLESDRLRFGPGPSGGYQDRVELVRRALVREDSGLYALARRAAAMEPSVFAPYAQPGVIDSGPRAIRLRDDDVTSPAGEPQG